MQERGIPAGAIEPNLLRKPVRLAWGRLVLLPIFALMLCARAPAQVSESDKGFTWRIEDPAQRLELMRAARLQDRSQGPISFTLPAQDLGKMVRAWGVQSKINIADVFDTDPPLRNSLHIKGNAVYGTMTAHEALCRILRGTEVSYIEAYDGGERSVSFGFQGEENWRDDHLRQISLFYPWTGGVYVCLKMEGNTFHTKLDLKSAIGFTFPMRSKICAPQSFRSPIQQSSKRRPVVTQPSSSTTCTCARNLYTGEPFPHVCWTQEETLRFEPTCEIGAQPEDGSITGATNAPLLISGSAHSNTDPGEK